MTGTGGVGSMQRYMIPAGQLGRQEVSLKGDDARHLSRVLRAEAGDRIICSNGRDREVLAEITEIGRDEVTASVIEELEPLGEPAVEVWVAQGMPKGDKLETVLQKCTELGASRFIPFESARTVVKLDSRKEDKRLVRWQRIVKEAAEQAHRSRLPEVAAVTGWREVLAMAEQSDLSLLFYEQERAQGLKDVLETFAPAGVKREAAGNARSLRLLLVVGPEGGFSEAEAEEAAAAGMSTVGLGRRILRTETAAMAGLACVLYHFGEMGG